MKRTSERRVEEKTRERCVLTLRIKNARPSRQGEIVCATDVSVVSPFDGPFLFAMPGTSGEMIPRLTFYCFRERRAIKVGVRPRKFLTANVSYLALVIPVLYN